MQQQVSLGRALHSQAQSATERNAEQFPPTDFRPIHRLFGVVLCRPRLRGRRRWAFPLGSFTAYALLSRIRLGSSRQVLKAAEDVVKHIVENYRKPNLTAEQIESVAVSDEDPLRNFSDICRVELESMQRQI
jgi:hypothetical protein